MSKKHFLLFLGIVLSFSACSKYPDLKDGLYAEFETNKGDFVAQLHYKKTPMTVANFVSLAEGSNKMVDSAYAGKKFYNGLTFHRIIKDFMIQGGDPQGNGQGGPGYNFPDEFDTTLVHDSKGMLSMANAGPGTNGSQFFITLAPTPHLNNKHTIFGKIVVGQKVVDSIGIVETEEPGDKPVEPVTINELNIIRKGKEAKKFDAPKVFKERLDAYEGEQKKKKEALEKEINTMAEGYKKTDTGLRYKITKENPDGKKPKRGQVVNVEYTGMLKDGTKFDSSHDHPDGKPLQFPVGVGRVIPGWDEGIRLLKTGEEARLIIPPYLGYGKQGIGPIPANSILVFDVKLVSIEDSKE